MGGVVFAVPVQVVAEAVVPHLAPGGNLLPQVVAVTSLAVHHLAEQAPAHHIQHHQLVAAETAVFQHHAGYARFLVGAHQLPAVLHRICARHLHGRILACAHGVAGKVQMGFPRRHNDHSVDFRHGQYLAVIRRSAGRGLARCRHKLHALLPAVLIIVAHGQHTNARLGQDTVFQQVGAAVAQADNTYIQYFFHKWILPFRFKSGPHRLWAVISFVCTGIRSLIFHIIVPVYKEEQQFSTGQTGHRNANSTSETSA